MAALEQRIRLHQEMDPVVGPLFSALHTWAFRVRSYGFAAYSVPHPIIGLHTNDQSFRGEFYPMDELFLPNRINLNIPVMRTGVDAVETLTHELVHLFQHSLGKPLDHDDFFRVWMQRLGIETKPSGFHFGYTDDGMWNTLLKASSDLQLDQFQLPASGNQEENQ